MYIAYVFGLYEEYSFRDKNDMASDLCDLDLSPSVPNTGMPYFSQI